ncbi:hypothetical protein H6768_02040 [Candidatus Peribacteria bacterium]|nr:hypothetical protein [Candidatus Peribacteria bacterium]
MRDKVTTLVVTPNPEMLYEAQQDKDFLDILQDAEYVLPDGVGIFVAYQLTASHSSTLIKLLLSPFWCARAVLHNQKFSEKYGNRITGAEITRELLLHASKTQTPVTIIDPIVHGHSLRDVEKKASQNTMRENLVHKYP